MTILICPDKFKDTFSSAEITNFIVNTIKKFDENIKTTCVTLADGGEGTLEILAQYYKAEIAEITVKNPLFIDTKAKYAYNNDLKTAFIELSLASGLHLLQENERNAKQTSTFGTGQLIKHALLNGAKRIILGIGGSATNDAGIGILTALGFVFLDKNGNELSPVGENLSQVNEIKASTMFDFSETEFIIACDVNNVLYGKNGAAYIYGKQKGLSDNEIAELDLGLHHFAIICNKIKNTSYEKKQGAGAAGGVGYGLATFLNATLVSGIDLIMNELNFEQLLAKTNLVITGEGKFDKQSMKGKVVGKVIEKCRKVNIPVAVLCGVCEYNYEFKNVKIFPIAEKYVSKIKAIAETPQKIENQTLQILTNYFSSKW